jgi:hypothetical protein
MMMMSNVDVGTEDEEFRNALTLHRYVAKKISCIHNVPFTGGYDTLST